MLNGGGRYAVAMAVMVASVSTAAQRQAPVPPAMPSVSTAKQAFASMLTGKSVTLNAPMYSVVATSTTTRSVARIGDRVLTRTDENEPEQEGINAVSPDAGAFFRYLDFSNGIQEVVDGDVNRFLERLNAIRGRVSSARLLTYAAGSKLRVRNVDWNRRLVAVYLVDPVSAQAAVQASIQSYATSLDVLWPTDLGDDFTERPQVEKLLKTFFDVAP